MLWGAAPQLALELQERPGREIGLAHRKPHPDHLPFGDMALELVGAADGFAEGIGLIDDQGEMAVVEGSRPGRVGSRDPSPWRGRMVRTKAHSQPQQGGEDGGRLRQAGQGRRRGRSPSILGQQLARLTPARRGG